MISRNLTGNILINLKSKGLPKIVVQYEENVSFHEMFWFLHFVRVQRKSGKHFTQVEKWHLKTWLTYPTANYVCDAASVLQCWESNFSRKTRWNRQFQKKLCKAHKRTNLVQSLPWNECILAMFCVQTSRGGCSDQNNLSDLTSEVRECHCTAPSLQGRWENTEATFTSLSCGAIYWSNSHPPCH